MRSIWNAFVGFFEGSQKFYVLRIISRTTGLACGALLALTIDEIFFFYGSLFFSVLADVVIFKVLNLKESMFKNPKYFGEDKNGIDLDNFDRYTNTVFKTRLLFLSIATSIPSLFWNEISSGVSFYQDIRLYTFYSTCMYCLMMFVTLGSLLTRYKLTDHYIGVRYSGRSISSSADDDSSFYNNNYGGRFENYSSWGSSGHYRGPGY